MILMTVRVTKDQRVRIEELKTEEGKKYIYESPDGGKTIKSRPAVDHPIHILINGSIPLKIWYEIYGT